MDRMPDWGELKQFVLCFALDCFMMMEKNIKCNVFLDCKPPLHLILSVIKWKKARRREENDESK